MKERRDRSSALAVVGLGVLIPAGWLAGHLPARAGLWLGRRIGDLIWLLLPRRRAVTLDNLARAFGRERSAAGLRRLGRRSFMYGAATSTRGPR